MCGDTCTESRHDCECGEVTLTHGDHWHHYCCLQPGHRCTKPDPYKETVCSRGAVVAKSQPCHGSCHHEATALPGADTAGCENSLPCLSASVPPEQCLFPFTFRDEVYHSCINTRIQERIYSNSTRSCPTEFSYTSDGDQIITRWSLCREEGCVLAPGAECQGSLADCSPGTKCGPSQQPGGMDLWCEI